MDKNIVKKQHYIPRFYLRNFSDIKDSNDRKNKILVYDKKSKREYSSNIYDIACENYFYDISNASSIEEKQLFEHAFSNLENKASIEIDKIIKRCEQKENYSTALIISKEEKEKLSFYITVQLFRTKKFRDVIKKPVEDLYEAKLKFLNIYLKQSSLEISENVRINIDGQKVHLNMLADNENLNVFANFFMDSNWCFLRNATDIPFITSDNPVCKVPIIDEETNIMLPFFTNGLYVYFPLSPQICIFIFRKDIPKYSEWKKNRNRLIPIKNLDTINFINQYQWLMANEKVFINPKYKHVVNYYIKNKSFNKKNYIF